LVSGSEQVSFNGIVDKPTLVSGSAQVTYSGLSGIPAGIVSSSTQITGYNIFATTGSNQFDGSQAITGSLTVTGQVVAQTLNVQQVTSSIVFSSGSNIFGNSLSNTQQFTGSVSVTGSLTVTTAGTELQVTSTGVNLGNALTDSHIISGSLRVNPNGLFVSGSGNVGIGTTSPSLALNVIGQIRAGYADNVGITFGLSPVGVPNNDNNAYILWGDTTTFGGNNGDLIYIPRSSTTGDHRFYTANTGLASEKMRITSGGNVGIGETNPSAKLHVVGTNGSIQIGGSGYTLNPSGMMIGEYISSMGYIQAPSGGRVEIWNGATENIVTFNNNKTTEFHGTLYPTSNGTIDLGTSSLRWATVYTSDLSLSNGIGDYTIVEGENDLFLYNNKQNKVYKFVIEEVDPSTATPKKS
jgi:hypothetical protein